MNAHTHTEKGEWGARRDDYQEEGTHQDGQQIRRIEKIKIIMCMLSNGQKQIKNKTSAIKRQYTTSINKTKQKEAHMRNEVLLSRSNLNLN